MSFSPLKKNYIHEIRNIKPFKPKEQQQKYKQYQQKSKSQQKQQKSILIYSDCIRSKICLQKQRDKFFEMILFENGIFNINLGQSNKLLSQTERKNISKLCIPSAERLLKGLYLFPTQTIIQCQYDLQSRFHKQMIIYCPGEYLIVNNFTNGRMDKDQFNFNLKNLILVKTNYHNDRIVKVTDYFLENDSPSHLFEDQYHPKLKIRLQKYLKDKKICQTIYQLIEGKFDWLEPIATRSGSACYYGQMQESQQLPNGIGLLINNKSPKKGSKKMNDILTNHEEYLNSGWQFYFGFFQHGLLHGIGQIWFQNKSSYFGQFQQGNAIGLGQFYSLEPSNNLKQQNPQCFSYKDDMRSINQNDFFRWLKESYFNGQKPYQKQKNKIFIQYEYQKLKKIYSIPKKKQIPIQNLRKQSFDQNSQEIDDLIDEMNQANIKIKDKNQPQNQDITFNKNDQIRDIFEKIKIKEQKNQKIPNKKNNINRMSTNTEVFQQNNRKNTSRSDDHTYNIFSTNKNQYDDKNFNVRKRNNTNNSYKFDDQLKEYQNFPHFQNQYIDGHEEIDLGFEEVDESYFRNRQANSSYKDMNDKDYIHKEYPFEEPKRFKAPDYFIVQYGKNDPKYDPTGAKSNLIPEDRLKKNEYPGPSPVKKEKYLSPQRKKNQINEKQNQHQLQKLQKTLTSAKNKRIFYNPSKKNQPL